MSRVNVDDRNSVLHALTRHVLRRRSRATIEDQTARCPRCDRALIVLMGKRGPCFRCGCKEPAVNDDSRRK